MLTAVNTEKFQENNGFKNPMLCGNAVECSVLLLYLNKFTMLLGSFILSSTDVSFLYLPLFPLLSPAPGKCTEAAYDLNIVPPPLH